jgi:hypothetical protein
MRRHYGKDRFNSWGTRARQTILQQGFRAYASKVGAVRTGSRAMLEGESRRAERLFPFLPDLYTGKVSQVSVKEKAGILADSK